MKKILQKKIIKIYFTNKNTNNKQVFNFENNYIKQALNNNKNEESFNAQNNNNFGISSVFKK